MKLTYQTCLSYVMLKKYAKLVVEKYYYKFKNRFCGKTEREVFICLDIL